MLIHLRTFALFLLLCLIGCSEKSSVAPVDQSAPNDLEITVSKVVVPNQPLPSYTIEFALPVAAWYKLEARTVTNHLVRRIHEGSAEAGMVNVEWDLNNDEGEPIKSGLYMLHLQAGSYEGRTYRAFCFTEEDCEDMYEE